jgi:hypothetical protein
MKVLKKLLLPIAAIIAFSAGTNQAMEKPDVKYSDPIEMYNSPEDFKISAKVGEEEIGSISYILEKRKAKMLLFTVNKEFRNNKQERVGQHLFQACVDDVIFHGYPQLEWTANPTSDLKIDTIVTIYEKMIKKLENADSYRFTKGEEYGVYNPKVNMKLIFKKV